MRYRTLILIAIAWYAISGCHAGPNGPATNSSSLRLLPASFGDGVFLGAFHSVDYVDGSVYAFTPLRLYELDDTLGLVRDSVIGYRRTDTNLDVIDDWAFSLRIAPDKNRLLYINSTDPYFADGALVEYDLHSGLKREILDSNFHIASACYGSGDTVFVYSHGSVAHGIGAGYYLVLKSSATVHLLYAYSSAAPREVMLGFDVAPQDGNLYIPGEGLETGTRIYRYNYFRGERSIVASLQGDTAIGASMSLRVNSSDSKLFFTLTPPGVPSQDSRFREFSTLGVVNLQDGATRYMRPVAAGDYCGVYTSPCWGPDDHTLIFSYSRASSDGRISQDFQCAISRDIQ